MIPNGWNYFVERNVLLLQGPVGPFFGRLSRLLKDAGAKAVYKVNFNGGDWLFAPAGAFNYTGAESEWVSFLEFLLRDLQIDTIMLFGDCRRYHVAARNVARARNVETWVFEEGYIRPDFVTMERDGTNGHSSLPRDANFYRNLPECELTPEREVGRVFGHLAVWAGLYGAAAMVGRMFFPHYRHHRPLSLREGGRWVRAGWRKIAYKVRERGMVEYLVQRKTKAYFLVSLQTASDSQIRIHSRFASLDEFIEEVIRSFSCFCDARYDLVFKHHPLDRGHNDYGGVIGSGAAARGMAHRVAYIHDQHLPTLLEHAAGLILVNSTVGISGIHHGLPVKVLGEAIYDLDGLSFQGSLDDFWAGAGSFHPDMLLYRRFRSYVVDQTQLNGSFYTGHLARVAREERRPEEGPGIDNGRLTHQEITLVPDLQDKG